MKCNVNTVLFHPSSSSNVVLVPYAKHHVPRYNEWMQSEELRELTASEPLTLEEEYEMQEKWQEDEDKLTFIILSRTTSSSLHTSFGQGEGPEIRPDDPRLQECQMVGDVNLFLSGDLETLRAPLRVQSDEDPEDEEPEGHAEVEIMIAEADYRRKGYALQALQVLLSYATGRWLGPLPDAHGAQPTEELSSSPDSSDLSSAASPLNIHPTRLLCRITESNAASIRLFEKLGFKITKRVEVFKEVEMRWEEF
ncbi:GNAT domain-containing protein [Coprinopsis sp. MPI-PUGE-AT-0042]|nr:GNAT domain-containing protein [Coprinopsis sp. MPI-PUGE-AT-0042]